MRELYQALDNIFMGDSDLKGLVNYTQKKLNIRRGFQPPDENWNKSVIYYTQGGIPKTDFNPQFRDIPLIVRVYDRKDDLSCSDIAERIILLLEGADLTTTDKLKVFDCSYTGDLVPLSWNQTVKSWEQVLRFMIVVRVDKVTGSSGYPTRKLGRIWK